MCTRLQIKQSCFGLQWGSLHCVLRHNTNSQSVSSLPDVNMGSCWWGITLQWTASQYEVGNGFHINTCKPPVIRVMHLPSPYVSMSNFYLQTILIYELIMTMYSLPFSYSDSPLFKPNFCFVFHFEKVDQKIASVYHQQEIINIKNIIDLRKKDNK